MGSCARAWHPCPRRSGSGHTIWKKFEGEARLLPWTGAKPSALLWGSPLLPPCPADPPQCPSHHHHQPCHFKPPPTVGEQAGSCQAATERRQRKPQGVLMVGQVHQAGWLGVWGASNGAPRRGREQAGSNPRPGLAKTCRQLLPGGLEEKQPAANNADFFSPFQKRKKKAAEISRAREAQELLAPAASLFLFQLPRGEAQGARRWPGRRCAGCCPPPAQTGSWDDGDRQRSQGRVAEWRSCDQRVPGWGGEGKEPSLVGKERRRAGSQK